MSELSATALGGLPEIGAGADLAALIAGAAPTPLRSGDVLVIAHKMVSKAEGRVRALADVKPSARAQDLAQVHDKDPRLVQVILDESRDVLRATRGILVCVTHHGFVCANAGVDASNASEMGSVVLLPLEPDASARALRARLRTLTNAALGIVITDTFGRPWRLGQCDVAVGCAGVSPLEDWRGRRDAMGRPLHATWIAIADELAAAADLARTKDGSQPVVVITGAARFVTETDGPGAAALLRPEPEDLFR